MNKQRLDEIRAREQAATPGPWKAKWEYSYDPNRAWAEGPSHEAYQQGADLQKAVSLAKADAAFIAHARADVPELLAEVERLRGALAKIKALATYDIDHEEDGNTGEIETIASAALEEKP